MMEIEIATPQEKCAYAPPIPNHRPAADPRPGRMRRPCRALLPWC